MKSFEPAPVGGRGWIWGCAALSAGAFAFGGFLWFSAPETASESSSFSMEDGVLGHPGQPVSPSLPFSESASLRTMNGAIGASERGEGAERGDLKELAGRDPVAAARAVEAIREPERRIAAMRAVLQEWATVSPEEAQAWAGSLRGKEDRELAREFICYRVAEEDPLRALAIAVESGAGGGDPVVQNLAQRWASKDAGAALDWAHSLTPEQGRDRVLGRMAYVLAQTDPESAGRIVAEEIPFGREQEAAAMSVLQQWGSRDLSSAEAWVERFPDGSLRARAEKELEGIRRFNAGN